MLVDLIKFQHFLLQEAHQVSRRNTSTRRNTSVIRFEVQKIRFHVYTGYEYDGGIIITASHLPYNRNGFKFFTKDGGLEKGDIKSILQRAAAAAHASGMSPNARHSDDAQVINAAINIDPSSAPQVSYFWSGVCFRFFPNGASPDAWQ